MRLLSRSIFSIPFASKVIVTVDINRDGGEAKKFQFQHIETRYILNKFMIEHACRREFNARLIELRKDQRTMRNAELCNLTFVREIFFLNSFD